MSQISRRTLMGAGMGTLGLALAGCTLAKSEAAAQAGDFVTVDGIDFKLKGQTYRYVGANIW